MTLSRSTAKPSRTKSELFEFFVLHGSQERHIAARYGQAHAVPLSRSGHKAHDASLNMQICESRGAESVTQVLIDTRSRCRQGCARRLVSG